MTLTGRLSPKGILSCAGGGIMWIYYSSKMNSGSTSLIDGYNKYVYETKVSWTVSCKSQRDFHVNQQKSLMSIECPKI
jgi:hypothetical protein